MGQVNKQDWLNGLNEDERKDLASLQASCHFRSDFKVTELKDRHNLRRRVALSRFRDYRSFAQDELYKAGDELSRFTLSSNLWPEIENEINTIQEELRERKTTELIPINGEELIKGITDENGEFLPEASLLKLSVGGKPFYPILHNHFVDSLLEDLIIKSVLAQNDDSAMIDSSENSVISFEISNLKNIDWIIEFVGRLKWLIEMVNIVEDEMYETIATEPRRELSFTNIFQPLIRDKIPGKVIQLLGPGQADAWRPGPVGRKIWCYDGPGNAIMIPFFQLVEMKHILIGSGDKKLKITAWLKEFGVEYRERKYDSPSRTISHIEFFAEYLNKLKE